MVSVKLYFLCQMDEANSAEAWKVASLPKAGWIESHPTGRNQMITVVLPITSSCPFSLL